MTAQLQVHTGCDHKKIGAATYVLPIKKLAHLSERVLTDIKRKPHLPISTTKAHARI